MNFLTVNETLVLERRDRIMQECNEVLFPEYDGIEYKAAMSELFEIEIDLLYDPTQSLWTKQNALDRINKYLNEFKRLNQ